MEAIKDTLQAIGEAMRLHMIKALESGKHPLDRNTSKSLKSLSVQVNQSRNAAGQFQGFSPSSQVVLWAEDYLEYLNWGRYSVKEKPSIKKVPISALLKWIKQRRIRGRVRKGKGAGRFISDNRLAFMIQNSIYKNGIRGRHFIQPALKHGDELFDIYINNQLLEDMTYEFDRVMKFGSTGRTMR
ncbi:hypothetical protein [Rufibacter quisquiliarum]|uniref:Uncharacterized protein n=1 Tax=Rufibacter quisquiliarum TaxID=1549639 RepID=A0A839GCJ4_9BACT|nr:hypothetical protein [Rufibacter quisquiliarum]MBA9076080.1 hypothetical protein [Rufibacter quisquiliarum]